MVFDIYPLPVHHSSQSDGGSFSIRGNNNKIEDKDLANFNRPLAINQRQKTPPI